MALYATYDDMQHYSSVTGLLNQTENDCGGVSILKKKLFEKEQMKNVEKRKLAILRIYLGLAHVRTAKGKFVSRGTPKNMSEN